MGKMTSSGVMFGLRWRNVRGVGCARSVAVADKRFGFDRAQQLLRCSAEICAPYSEISRRHCHYLDGFFQEARIIVDEFPSCRHFDALA